MPRRDERLVSDYFKFTPGPLWRDEKFYSWDAYHFQEYPHETVAKAILAFPNTKQTHPPSPDWPHFAARWKAGKRKIDLDFMPDVDQFGADVGRPWWTGCNLNCDCLVGDLIDLWKAMRKKCPGVWVYDPGVFDPKGSLLLNPRGFLRMPSIVE